MPLKPFFVVIYLFSPCRRLSRSPHGRTITIRSLTTHLPLRLVTNEETLGLCPIRWAIGQYIWLIVFLKTSLETYIFVANRGPNIFSGLTLLAEV